VSDDRTPALEIRGWSINFGGRRILDDVSLTLGRGEYLALIGPNGAGKTTLLRCVLRVQRGGSGTIRVGGRDLSELRQVEIARAIGYVAQAGGPQPPFCVRDFVLQGRYPYLSPFTPLGKDDRRAVDQAMELTGTAVLGDRRMGTLSGGERQRVCIAAALAQGASTLLLDEPTTFLDPKHQAEVLSILHRVHHEQGTSILSVTHDINTAVTMADRVAALRAGRVVFRGTPAQLMEGGELAGIFDHEFTFAQHPVTGDKLVVP